MSIIDQYDWSNKVLQLDKCCTYCADINRTKVTRVACENPQLRYDKETRRLCLCDWVGDLPFSLIEFKHDDSLWLDLAKYNPTPMPGAVTIGRCTVFDSKLSLFDEEDQYIEIHRLFSLQRGGPQLEALWFVTQDLTWEIQSGEVARDIADFFCQAAFDFKVEKAVASEPVPARNLWIEMDQLKEEVKQLHKIVEGMRNGL
jgi:hypothetical protein